MWYPQSKLSVTGGSITIRIQKSQMAFLMLLPSVLFFSPPHRSPEALLLLKMRFVLLLKWGPILWRSNAPSSLKAVCLSPVAVTRVQHATAASSMSSASVARQNRNLRKTDKRKHPITSNQRRKVQHTLQAIEQKSYPPCYSGITPTTSIVIKWQAHVTVPASWVSKQIYYSLHDFYTSYERQLLQQMIHPKHLCECEFLKTTFNAYYLVCNINYIVVAFYL